MDADGGLTREDFDSHEDWLRYCHEGGLDVTEGREDFAGIRGTGYYASLHGAILGQSRRTYRHTWLEHRRVRVATNSISRTQFSKARRAVAFANCMGMVMNTAVDITWSTVGVTGDASVARRQMAFLDALRRWFDRNGVTAAWVWVLEQGETLGLHSHILMHVPDELTLEFRNYAKATLTRIVKRPLLNTDDLKTLLIQHRRREQIIPQWWRFRYMMKGVKPNLVLVVGEEFGQAMNYADRVGVSPKPQGDVGVKRLGVSRALDDSAFKRWAALNEFPDVAIRPNADELYDDRFLRWFWENGHQLRVPGMTRNGNSQPC